MRQAILIFCLSAIIASVNGQSTSVNSPVFKRGLWCAAYWSEITQSYTQVGQIFFYNNDTFSLNFLNDPLFTWSSHLVAINNTDTTKNISQVFSFTTRGLPPYVGQTSCFWEQHIENGDIVFGRQANGTCTPTFENDTSTQTLRYTRNSNSCVYIDDDKPSLIISNTSFETNTLLLYDRALSSAKQKSIVFYGSSSIDRWTTLTQDFPNYNVLNRGFGGSLLLECSQEFKRIVYPLDPPVLVIYAGENDIAAGQTPLGLQSIFRQFIPIVRRFYPDLPIAYISIKPSIAREDKMPLMDQANQLIRSDIETMFPGVTFINVWPLMLLPNGKPNPDIFGPDKLHMNSKGYAIWTTIITQYFESLP